LAGVVQKYTAVTLLIPVPVIVTIVVPVMGPEVGVNDVIVAHWPVNV
jgi:hypothetical protein